MSVSFDDRPALALFARVVQLHSFTAAAALVEVLTDYQSEPLGIYALLADRTHAAPAARALVQHLAAFFRARRGR